nr:response regulator [Pedobacter panaciterrae]
MDNDAHNLQSLIEAMDDVILELTEQSVIKRVWAKDKSKLFMPPEFFIDKSIPEVFGEFGNIFINCINNLLRTGERQQCIYPDFDKNKNLWYCAKFQKIDSSNTDIRIVCIIEDITVEKEMTDQLEKNRLELIEAKNLAEQVARKRTETLSIMSHEIRTPLNAIIGISNLLDQATFSNKDIKEYVDHLSYSSNHLLRLINDILDLEKIESKKMELNETPTNLISLINNVYKQFLPFAKTKNLSLYFNHDCQTPEFLLIDDLRLTRILNNLIANAIKFTEKGEVCITLKTLVNQDNKASILFKISDTGIGIPEHLHNLIFDKFHQVNQDSHRQQEGSGLGLNITRGLVRLFNSEIHLTSKPSVGSVFEFQIDFKKNMPLLPQPEKKAESTEFNFPPLPDFKLLIVDDNPTNLLVATRQLSRFGIHSDKADNGYSAIEFLKTKEYDVVLVDLHMPGMDGYQLAKYIQEKHPETKVIIFTADVLEEVKLRLKEMGIQYILSKPFKPEEMFDLFLEVLESK